MKIRKYSIETKKPNIDLKICLVSDLHSIKHKRALASVKSIDPDLIICPGDILERLDGLGDHRNAPGFKFLSRASKIAPTFYSFGNHERFGSHMERASRPKGHPEVTEENYTKIIDTGVNLINDDYKEFKKGESKIIIGGLMPAFDRPQEDPNLDFIAKFSKIEGFKILSCHQPEYYDSYLKDCDFDLMLSGHTHGGQWKLFGKGIYAPNQGLFPKYSSGFYHNKLILSAGASNSKWFIPRFFNPCEIIEINIKSI